MSGDQYFRIQSAEERAQLRRERAQHAQEDMVARGEHVKTDSEKFADLLVSTGRVIVAMRVWRRNLEAHLPGVDQPARNEGSS